MIEVAEVVRRFAADYLSAHGASILPSHQHPTENTLACRTAALGGQVWRCEQCNTEMFSYHSCGNRSCPKCHTAQTQEWLEHRRGGGRAGATFLLNHNPPPPTKRGGGGQQ